MIGDASPRQTSPTTPNRVGLVQGQMIGLPENFPEDFIFYPTATIISSNSHQNGTDQVTLLAEGVVDRIKEFHKTKLLDTGWRLSGTDLYQRRDQTLAFDFIEEKEGQTVVIINHSFVPTK